MDTTTSNEDAEDDVSGSGNDPLAVQSSNTNAPNDKSTLPSSQLFTVRIWPEITPGGVITWRGKVHHVSNGAWRNFHEWHGLRTFLQSQVEEFVNTGQYARDTQPDP